MEWQNYGKICYKKGKKTKILKKIEKSVDK